MERQALKYCDYSIVLSRNYFHFLLQKLYINSTRMQMLHLPPPLLSRQKVVGIGTDINAVFEEDVKIEQSNEIEIVPILLFVGAMDASSGVSQFMSAVQLLEDNLSDRIVPGDNYHQMNKISRYDVAIFGSGGFHRKYGLSYWSELIHKFCSHINLENKHYSEVASMEGKNGSEHDDLEKPILRRCVQNSTLYIDPADIFISLDEINFFATYR